MLGDKSLKVKYLNPNLLLVASGTPLGFTSESLGQDVQALHILLVDAVTGRPVFRQSHKVSLMRFEDTSKVLPNCMPSTTDSRGGEPSVKDFGNTEDLWTLSEAGWSSARVTMWGIHQASTR